MTWIRAFLFIFCSGSTAAVGPITMSVDWSSASSRQREEMCWRREAGEDTETERQLVGGQSESFI